jgi:spore coat polysaccharide biosynthesis protein SpsF
MTQKIVAVVAVRMSSERLPGKTLKVIGSKPLLAHLLDRVRKAHYVDSIIVATSIAAEDDAIEEFCKSYNTQCYRGDKDNVLQRITDALTIAGASIGINIYGDGPLICPEIIDYMTLRYRMEECDFLCNNLKTTFAPGMEVEVFSIEVLKKACSLANKSEEKEHATLFIRKNEGLFKIKNVCAEKEYYLPDVHLEVDEKEDLTVVEQALNMQNQTKDYSFFSLFSLSQKNNLSTVNQDTQRRWKIYRKD